jgi:hypothetical protein
VTVYGTIIDRYTRKKETRAVAVVALEHSVERGIAGGGKRPTTTGGDASITCFGLHFLAVEPAMLASSSRQTLTRTQSKICTAALHRAYNLDGLIPGELYIIP